MKMVEIVIVSIINIFGVIELLSIEKPIVIMASYGESLFSAAITKLASQISHRQSAQIESGADTALHQ